MSNEELIKRIEELELIIESMRNASTMPFDIGAAISGRVGDGVTSSGTAGSASNTTVNEGGVASYPVAAALSGTIAITVAGQVYNVAYY